MHVNRILPYILLLVASCGPLAWSAAERPATPGAPGRSFRAIPIGPGDSTAYARKMRGKMTLICAMPPSVQPKTVDMVIDGRSIGQSLSSPFPVEFDSTTVTDGEHVIKAIGRDAGGKEVWTASTKVNVLNSAKAGPEATAMRLPGGAMPPSVMPPGGRRPRTEKSSRPEMSGKQGKGSLPIPAGVALERTYSNYGFSINYPGTWTFKDRSVSMKSKAEGDCWVAFGDYPIEKAKLVVNVRRTKLEPGTNAAKFVEYNSYVKKWESTTILGSPAFATTTRLLTPQKGVIHRAIIIKHGSAWMLNCEDFSGKPADESLGLFEGMIQTMSVSGAAK